VLSAGNIQVRSGKSTALPTAALPTAAHPANPAGGSVPVAYAFPPNFPNPFSVSTSFRYELPEQSHVTITVYDVMGRVVADLVDRVVRAGLPGGDVVRPEPG
jgi:hypothetical protein